MPLIRLHCYQFPVKDLLELEGAEEALDAYSPPGDEDSESSEVESRNPTRRRKSSRPSNNTSLSGLIESSDDELALMPSAKRARNRGRQRNSRITRSIGPSNFHTAQSLGSRSSSESSEQGRRRSSRNRSTKDTRQKQFSYFDSFALVDESDTSEMQSILGKRKRRARKPQDSPEPTAGTRKSGRNVRSTNMREVGEDDIPTQVTTSNAIKFVGAKEKFKKLAPTDDFRLRHSHFCDTCDDYGDSTDRGRLVYCQGCTLSYHQKCLGPRNTRDHLVTKVADDDFVLQCRRCISFAKSKDPIAPDQSKCFVCTHPSSASHPFRQRKSIKQEQKERDDNGGEDPITAVLPDTVNNPDNVLFRCLGCLRVCHFHHLPPRENQISAAGLSDEHLADERFAQYCKTWTCKDCKDAPGAIDTLVAWRPAIAESYQPGTPGEIMNEESKSYLIKWKKLPYSKALWMPGPWVWGVTPIAMRKAFVKRDENTLPKMHIEDAIPEDFHRIDIVFDIKYTNVVKVHTAEVDQARIKEVEQVLVKFKGLGYEDVVWIRPPKPEEKERWEDFRIAYNDWVMGSHIHPPPPSTLNAQLQKLRSRHFGTQVKLEAQPESLTGGQIMDYQLEGVNWLYYQWFIKQNAILADEMGLGKTIQIIGFLTTLVQRHTCFPFLVVVPNSTCPNWRREIQKWAPSMRVVTYYGTSESRKLSQKYELFPGGAKELRCHVVVTSYDAAQDGEFRKVFRGVHWAGLVVDEGQRLKNDKNILYRALNAFRFPLKILLTGTPLQNNARELFNLLQFLDTSLKAKELEEEYAELTTENVRRLHDMLRPFFLRRTKAQVLTFLPPMAQIIVPVSLTSLQKKLYRSILAKNPELIKSIFGTGKKVKQQERASLNNILMQLRKCLCHPFVYSRAIEQVDPNPAIIHRNLVDASSKLKLLEIMLPKLQEHGHRVLIFSQFLDMLDLIEDFMDAQGLYYQRLDGSMGSLQKQKRIDEFNAPDSPLFAFLLSTRAGGVGINLATADTVIILDPDFNPHQDIQALSRAHRIGQKKKVIVFQLTTRGTAEEKIMQVGKKKMALDHVMIESMEAEDNAGMDLESILRYGTDAIFKDDNVDDDIRYDPASVDKLLDRSQMEDTLPGKDNSAESQFSFARVWANEKGALIEEGIDDSTDQEADPSVWDSILKEREREAAVEAAAAAEALGRGRRKRQTIDYTKQVEDAIAAESSPMGGKPGHSVNSDSDTDFQIRPGDESDVDSRADEGSQNVAIELGVKVTNDASAIQPVEKMKKSSISKPPPPPHFRRAVVPLLSEGDPLDSSHRACLACGKHHRPGYCPLMVAGVEHCELCGIAHYGHQRACPHLTSVTQLRLMVEAIKNSTEPQEIKDLAKKRVVGIIGSLNQTKRQKKELKRQKEDFDPAHEDLLTNGHILS